MFLARFLLGCLFYLGGVQNILMWTYTERMVAEDVRNVFPFVPRRVIPALFALATGTQLVASVGFIIGVFPRTCAKLLLLFLVPVTMLVHDMWTIEDEDPPGFSVKVDKKVKKKEKKVQKVRKVRKEEDDSFFLGARVAPRSVATFLTDFDNEFVHFFKNEQIMGGLVLYLELTAES